MVAMLVLGLGGVLLAETFRGPTGDPLRIAPATPAVQTSIGPEGIILIELSGDHRFLDAIDLEITVPRAVSEAPGAVLFQIIGPIVVSERGGVVQAVGPELFTVPMQRPGKLFFQLPVREGAAVDASAAVQLLPAVSPDSFPLAISFVPRMKGLSTELQQADFLVSANPVTRNLGGVRLVLMQEDRQPFPIDSTTTPGFSLAIDGRNVAVQPEYLLEPGLHRIRLTSERYRDQEATFGVERGAVVEFVLSLERALAEVAYTAPREATVYLNGRALDASSGVFTAPPGEHTIVVVVGDYTITRRFTVSGERSYRISVSMDLTVEEIK